MNAPTETAYRWEPSDEQKRTANLTALLAAMGLDSYPALLEATARDIRPFNETIVETLDLRWDRPWNALLDLSRGKPFARWFVGAQYHAAAN